MNPIKMFLVLLCLLIFQNGYTQLFHPFQGIGEVILFADTLNACDQADTYIGQIKDEVSHGKTSEPDKAWYNLAVCYAAKRQADSACYCLSKCIGQSANYHNLILTDTDFEFLHQTSCWDKITARIDSSYLNQNPGLTNPELAVELYHIFLKDQHARGLGLKRRNKDFSHTDQQNLERVEEIIAAHGWPTFSMVGKTSANAAFLVIQHADIHTQRKYVKHLLEAARDNEASRESLALMMDRISVRLKGMQIFGTQVYRKKDPETGKPGQYLYFPIKDEERVDDLREEMGLIPLKDYYAVFGIDYEPPTE